jgi:protein-S-isoprenylcysteine O-methyltransferase Ste14
MRLLLGEAWLFESITLFKYTLLVFIAFHLFVMFYEEPTLESHFGESYRAYRKAVARWGLTVRPFHDGSANAT